jgi:hypothetical protein
VSIPVHVLPLALALAGAAGLRAFMPLFYLCLAVHIGQFGAHQVNPQILDYLDLVHSDAVLIGLGAAMAAEVLIEKIPPVAAALDLPLLLLRIVAAIVTAFAVLPIRDFSTAFTVASIIGFIGAIAIINLQVRQVSSDVRRLPLYVHFAASLLMDGICLAVSSISLQLAYVGLVILYPGTWLATLFMHSWSRTVEQKVQVAALGPAPELPEEFLRRDPGGATAP